MKWIEVNAFHAFNSCNLNRNEDGTAKRININGIEKDRISSQCLKRAVRTALQGQEGFSSYLTRLAFKKSMDIATSLLGTSPTKAQQKAIKAELTNYFGVKFKDDESDTNKVLIFASLDEIEYVTRKALEMETSDPGRNIDQSLFGRMLADMPTKNIEAATQWSHSVSIYETNRDYDLFSAVDDLIGEDSGAGHLGNREIMSNVFFRRFALNIDLFESNTARKWDDLTSYAAKLASAFVMATPISYRTSMNADSPPFFISIMVADKGMPLDLYNPAFGHYRENNDNDYNSLIDRYIKVLDSRIESFGSVYNPKIFKWLDSAYGTIDGCQNGDYAEFINGVIEQSKSLLGADNVATIEA